MYFYIMCVYSGFLFSRFISSLIDAITKFESESQASHTSLDLSKFRNLIFELDRFKSFNRLDQQVYYSIDYYYC
jgi:hypothetical protein